MNRICRFQKLFVRSRFQRNFHSRLIRFRGKKGKEFSHAKADEEREYRKSRAKKKEEKGIIVTFESVLKASFLLFPSAHPFSTKTFRRKQVPSFLPNLILEDRDESLPVPSLYDR